MFENIISLMKYIITTKEKSLDLYLVLITNFELNIIYFTLTV